MVRKIVVNEGAATDPSATYSSTLRATYAAATRATVLAAARTCFATNGWAGTSAERIAVAAGVAKGSVFHHFGDKRGLFSAVFADEEERLLERLAAALPADAGPRRLLELGAQAFLEACRDRSTRELLLVQAPEALGWARWKALEQEHFLGLVRDLVARLVPEGRADLASRLVIALLDESGLVVWEAADPAEAVEVAVTAVLAVVDGAAGRRT